MGHTIVNPARIVVIPIQTTMATLHTDLQTTLQGMDAGDVIIDIEIVKQADSTDCMCYVTIEV
jgi:hypothetical protein